MERVTFERDLASVLASDLDLLGGDLDVETTVSDLLDDVLVLVCGMSNHDFFILG